MKKEERGSNQGLLLWLTHYSVAQEIELHPI
ncbi:uncharacterized protein METZ01_LOCUS315961, partial [marine metagenome]